MPTAMWGPTPLPYITSYNRMCMNMTVPLEKGKARLLIPEKKKSGKIKKHFVHLFILPALLFYIVFEIYPILSAFLNSFYSFTGYRREAFIGLENFIRLFTEQPFKGMFTNAVTHNLVFLIVTIVSQLAVSFMLALMINSIVRGREFFKLVYFIPKLLSVIVVGFLFSLILNPTHGALNSFLNLIGLDFLARPWLGDTDTALVTIILVHSWYTIGFSVLIFLAGLQAIPGEIYESARLDGASGLKMLTKITIPLLMPSIMILSILTIIESFETFELIFAMEGSSGGPYYSTDVLGTFFYRLAFGSVEGGSSIGLGSAVAIILFLIVASVSAVSLFFFRRKELDY